METENKVLKAFCTTHEAARLLGVSVRTVQLWAESGLLQGWKTGGGHRRIARQSVEQLLATQSHASPSLAAPDAERLAILVVDDEIPDLELYLHMMGKWPFKPAVVTARSGTEALVKIGMAPPDLLITDLRMPDMDGFKMIATLRTMPELAGMAMIAASGMDAEQILAAGGLPDGVLVLPKPIPFERLPRHCNGAGGPQAANPGEPMMPAHRGTAI